MASLIPITLVVASPNDVFNEREAVSDAVDRLNRNYLTKKGYIIQVFRWEVDSYPGVHPKGPQGIVDDSLSVKNCDILTGIFWKRLGTPIEEGGETGTEHEINEAYEAWKKNGKIKPQILLYFNDDEVYLKDTEEVSQYLKVKQFKESLPEEIFFWHYKDLQEFKTLIYDHLSKAIDTLVGAHPKPEQVNNQSNDEYVFFSKWDLNEDSHKFHFTEGVDIDSKGYIYVADEAGYIRKFDSIGNLITKWGGRGTKDGEFQDGYALAVDSSDNILVSDSAGRIQKFNSEGTFLTKWGSLGKAQGQFQSPYGIAVDSFGNIFVSEEGNHRIQKFNASGEFLATWGEEGNRHGQFDNPIGIAINSQNNVYVADYLNHRVQVFDNSGNFIHTWGSKGTREGQFDHPHGITLDVQDMVYVSDSENSRIQKFSGDGVFLTSWGAYGEEDSQLRGPRDLVVDKNGIVYVSDGANNRIQIFIPKNSNAYAMLNKLQEESREKDDMNQIKLYLNKINAKDKPAAETGWKGIEKLARYRIIWNEEIWSAINRELLQQEPGLFVSEALDVLKTMLHTSKNKLGSGNEILIKAKSLYLDKLSEILKDVSKTWQYQKLFAKLVLDIITTEHERFCIFWKAWRACATEIESDNVFLKYTSPFINDLENSKIELKRSVLPEILNLIESKSPMVSKRASAIHSLLF